jgi:hypothetical protein
VYFPARKLGSARGEAERLITLSAGKYLPYDTCIRLFGTLGVLFCTFADFYKITNVKLFDIPTELPTRYLHFSYLIMIIYYSINIKVTYEQQNKR